MHVKILSKRMTGILVKIEGSNTYVAMYLKTI